MWPLNLAPNFSGCKWITLDAIEQGKLRHLRFLGFV